MRRRLAALRERIRSMSVYSKICVATGAIGLTIVVAGVATPSEEPAPTLGPTFSYATDWNLLELQRHIEAGEVLAVTVHAPPDAETGREGVTSLVAKLEDGQTVLVNTEIAAGDAAAALRVLGYGELLTTEARDAMPGGADQHAGSVAGSLFAAWLREPWASFFGLFVLATVALVVIGIIRRSAPVAGIGGPGRSGRLVKGGRTSATAAAGKAEIGTGVRWDHVAGCEEAKLELVEAVEFLKDPTLFARLGAKIPRGVMLWGPPGTGKTMLAKAAATEAGVPFIQASASEFVEMFVGRGAARVRGLFAEARKHGKAVLFIDEFDAVGKKRGGLNSHEEREQTLNQILVEMDGFDTTDGVIVIAATNRVETLDPAILRPGRFTRQVNVPLPDVKGREAILRVHAAGKPLAGEVDLGALARRTTGMAGADLANVLNEAAILAAREGAGEISSQHVRRGWLKAGLGTSRQRSMDLRERSIIAVHEAGHAIAGRAHGDQYRVEEISLFAHGNALGVTVSAPVRDNDLPSEQDLRARLIALMGGRVAEELVFHDYTGGASNDFEKATEIATRMVVKWGMGYDPTDPQRGATGRGRLSFIVGDENGKISPDLQPAVDRAVAHILDGAVVAARTTLLEQMSLLRRVSAHLVRHERMDGDSFEAICTGELNVDDAEAEWRPVETKPRAWEEIPAFARAIPAQAAPAAVPAAPDPGVVEAPARSRRSRRPRSGRLALGSLLRRGASAALRLIEEGADRPVAS